MSSRNLQRGTSPTAREIVDRIRREVGMPWNDSTYRDTFKAGAPDALVTGIASVFMASLDVLQRARAAGVNMVITHEPTFWSDGDVMAGLTDDPYVPAEDGIRRPCRHGGVAVLRPLAPRKSDEILSAAVVVPSAVLLATRRGFHPTQTN